MIYVGIDIAKLNHYAVVISSDGVVLTEPFKFTNDGDGFLKLSDELSDYAPEPASIFFCTFSACSSAPCLSRVT